MDRPLDALDATDLAAAIRDGATRAVDVADALAARAAALDPQLNALVATFPDVRERATAADRAVAAGAPLGPLHGVPFTVKDSLDSAGVRTARGSLLFADHIPARDAVVVERLRAAGGIALAKTNVPEFVLWWETGNRLDGTTCNPWDVGRSSGGSSGGEAAAVAAGLSPLGIGSDLGGSVRLPASWCGVVGLKPSHGRVPLTGHWPDVLPRFMHVGFLARSVRDVALALGVACGADGPDHYALAAPAPTGVDGPVAGLRVGVVADDFGPVDPEVRAALCAAADALRAAGCVVEDASVSALAEIDWHLRSLVLYGAGGGAFFRRVIGDRAADLSPQLARRLGAPPPSLDDYVRVEEQVEQLRADVAAFFCRHDVLLCPTTLTPASRHEVDRITVDGVDLPARATMRATIPFDLTGSPALSVPFGLTEGGLPLAVQVVGGRLADATVLRVGAALEAARGPLPRPPAQA